MIQNNPEAIEYLEEWYDFLDGSPDEVIRFAQTQVYDKGGFCIRAMVELLEDVSLGGDTENIPCPDCANLAYSDASCNHPVCSECEYVIVPGFAIMGCKTCRAMRNSPLLRWEEQRWEGRRWRVLRGQEHEVNARGWQGHSATTVIVDEVIVNTEEAGPAWASSWIPMRLS